MFERFRETTGEIARLQSKLREGRHSSNRIRQLYRQRTKRRDHAQNALTRDLVERLYEEGVATIYVGDLTGVLETYWSVRVNEKTHNFWAFKKFIHRLRASVRNTVSVSKSSQKRGRAKHVLIVVTTRGPFATGIH